MLTWLRSNYQSIQDRYQRGQLHHGLIFHGRQGVGKSRLCRELAKVLLCKQPSNDGPCGECQSCKLFEADNHPDFLQIQAENSIGVDSIREAISQLLHTSQLGGSKVLFIPEANRMTVAAANALLKTLEEPTSKTYIMMTCQSLHDLLPTVLSRCEKHALAVTDKTEVADWLGADIEPHLFELYWQRPLFLKAQLDDEVRKTFYILESISAGQSVPEIPVSFWEQPDLILNWIQQWLSSVLKTSSLDNNGLEFLLQFSQRMKNYQLRVLQQGANKKLQLSQCLNDFSNMALVLAEKDK